MIFVLLGSLGYIFCTAPPETTSTVQATSTLPSSSTSKNQNKILKESKYSYIAITN